jgi:hypothetical protein
MQPRLKQRLQLHRKRLELDGVSLHGPLLFMWLFIFPGCIQLQFLSALVCFAWACSYMILFDGLLHGAYGLRL